MGLFSSKEAVPSATSEQDKTILQPQQIEEQPQPVVVRHQPIIASSVFTSVAPTPIVPAYQRQQYESQWPALVSNQQSQKSSSSSRTNISMLNPPQAYAASVTVAYPNKTYSDHEVEYRRAKDAREAAKYLPPVSSGRGEEQVTEKNPWHPGQDRSFGFYRCNCGSKWTSAYSWADETQSCKDCGNSVLPHRQKPLDQNPDPEKLKAPHMQELCGKCQRLGRLCTLSMEPSKSAEHPNDVVVKGLPLDITEEQLIMIFRPYGAILRAYIPQSKPGFSNRIAFLTFQNPETALQKFNQVDVPTCTQKYKP